MKYVTLLRGINVGGNNKVDMKELKKLCEKLGFQHVSTYINSGNLFFDSEEKAGFIISALEKGIEEHFGFHIPIVLRNQAQIESVCRAIPKDWTNDDTMKTDVIFLWDDVNHSNVINEIKHTFVDTLIYVDGAVVWGLKRSDSTKSGMHDFIGTRIYKHMTARNVNTVKKIREMMNT